MNKLYLKIIGHEKCRYVTYDENQHLNINGKGSLIGITSHYCSICKYHVDYGCDWSLDNSIYYHEYWIKCELYNKYVTIPRLRKLKLEKIVYYNTLS